MESNSVFFTPRHSKGNRRDTEEEGCSEEVVIYIFLSFSPSEEILKSPRSGS